MSETDKIFPLPAAMNKPSPGGRPIAHCCRYWQDAQVQFVPQLQFVQVQFELLHFTPAAFSIVFAVVAVAFFMLFFYVMNNN